MILQGSAIPHSASRKRSKNVYYVYILRCSGDRLYTGITTDPERRLREHSGLDAGGARFTRANPPEGFAALWSTDTRSRAQSLEYAAARLH